MVAFVKCLHQICKNVQGIKILVKVFIVYTERETCCTKFFENADFEWLHCIVAHRRKGALVDELDKYNNIDIIAGKIANDDTNSTIVNYMARAFGPVGSVSADTICIGLLLPERLKNQYCFRTVNALKNLTFKGSEKSWM